MPSGDAVSPRPSLAEEMGRFQTFSTKDNEPLDPANEDLADAGGKNISEDEKKAGVTIVGDSKEVKTGKAAAKVPAAAAQKAAKLTDEESEAAITALDKALGREATEKEISDALIAATAEKNKGLEGEHKKRSTQDRINKAVRNQRAAERRADAAEARATAAEARLARGDTSDLTGDTKKATNDAAGAPDPKKYEFGELDTGYMRALARWEAKQEIAEQTEAQRKTQLTASERKAAEKFEETVTAFEEVGTEKYPDFADVVIEAGRNKEWPLSDELGALIFESIEEHGPDIAYMLATDLPLATKISKLPARQQLAWFGREQAKLIAGTGATDEDDEEGESEDDAAKKIPAQKVSKAPAPVTRARGQGSNSSVPGDTTDFRAFEASIQGQNKR